VQTTRTLGATVATVALAAAVVLGGTTTASAAPKTYANYAAVQKVYSGGIAKKSVTYNTVKTKSGKVEHRALKGTVKKDDALYNANKSMDADKDGIACEKS
jgi:hypothetical protein